MRGLKHFLKTRRVDEILLKATPLEPEQFTAFIKTAKLLFCEDCKRSWPVGQLATVMRTNCEAGRTRCPTPNIREMQGQEAAS